MVVNVHILYLFSHCVSFALLIIDFIVILHVRLIRVLLKINQSINQSINQLSQQLLEVSAFCPHTYATVADPGFRKGVASVSAVAARIEAP